MSSPLSPSTPVRLGVDVVRTPHLDITHHLVPSYALTPPTSPPSSAAQLVKPEWLTELLTLSDLNLRESPRALEHMFALPPESKFRPSFAAALPLALRTFKMWESNETRLHMLKGYRFVFVGKKGLEIPAGYRDLVKRGGAEYEAFTVDVGSVRWRKALLRAEALAEERNGKVVPVADAGAIELVVGAEECEKIDSVAKSLELEFIQPENILRAVASVDTFFVDSARTADPLGTLPNTLLGEPSIAPPIDRPHPEQPAQWPRHLNGPNPRLNPLNVLDPYPSHRSSRSPSPDAKPQFPHLDKYKALFDASNPDRVPSIDTQRGCRVGRRRPKKYAECPPAGAGESD
ncbi:hypothetical protein BC826DRAFT_1190684 [Russula brevipes]|nr:hypothetical protein BC826DRAFT_1190684 [Russula brevipes]